MVSSLLLTLTVLLWSASFWQGDAFAAPRQSARTKLFYEDERGPTLVATSGQSITPVPKEEPVYKRAQNYLTGSSLIYFFADLRMLSYLGHAVSNFKELDKFSDGGSITAFKLLEFILNELHAVIERNLDNDIKDKDWRSNASLLRILDTIVSLDAPSVEKGTQRAKDLDSLINTVNKIKHEETVNRLAHKLNEKLGLKGTKATECQSVFDVADMMDKGRQQIAIGAVVNSTVGAFRGAVNGVSSALTSAEKDVKEKIADPMAIWRIFQKTDETPAIKDDTDPVDGVPQLDYGENLIDPLIKGFTKSSLKEDAIFANVFKDDVELVYFDDRYQHKKCVYAIVINKTEKKVTVVFRGTTSPSDWSKNVQIVQEDTPNPAISVLDDTTGQPDKVGVHRGFYQFLRRKRLDYGHGGPENRFEYILQKVANYMTDDGWRLCVTGHSLGGALATLFGFYAAAEDRIMKTKDGQPKRQPVEVFSFASPLVGDERFRHAFKGLEENGKLIHARICNDGDFVTMLPFFGSPKNWKISGYQHCGLQIQLPPTSAGKSANIFHFGFSDENTFAKMKRTADNLLHWAKSIPGVTGALEKHSVEEYEKRLVKEMRREEKTNSNELNIDLDRYYKENILKK